MKYMQEAASQHAAQLGLGHQRLNELDGYWVLSNIRVEIDRLPRWNDKFVIKTWPSGYTRATATREFLGEDRNGRRLFCAGSEWMILDKRKKRPRNLYRLNVELPKTASTAVLGKLKRLGPQGKYAKAKRFMIPYSSVDLNGHVNNTEYVRWGMDVLRRTSQPKDEVRFVHTTYLSEVFENDEVDLLVCSGQGGLYSVLGKKSKEQSDVFVMHVGYELASTTATSTHDSRRQEDRTV